MGGSGGGGGVIGVGELKCGGVIGVREPGFVSGNC